MRADAPALDIVDGSRKSVTSLVYPPPSLGTDAPVLDEIDGSCIANEGELDIAPPSPNLRTGAPGAAYTGGFCTDSTPLSPPPSLGTGAPVGVDGDGFCVDVASVVITPPPSIGIGAPVLGPPATLNAAI